jgi:predicted GIY-YIG superfamily endonuclease
VKLVYSEEAADRGAAQRRELEIKGLSRAAKRALCSQLMTE